MVNKARICLMFMLLMGMLGCRSLESADAVPRTPSLTENAPAVTSPATTTPVAITTPPLGPENYGLETLDEAILVLVLGGARIIAIDPLEGTQHEIDNLPNIMRTGRRPVSPNGQWLVYVTISDTEMVDREYALVFLELMTGVSTTYSVPPVSGEMFGFFNNEYVLLPVLENNTTRVLWLFDVFQGTHTVVQEPFPYWMSGVSPEGNYLYIADEAGYIGEQVDLMSGSITGSPPVNLTSDPLRERQALWSPDGSKIVVLAEDPAQDAASPPCYCLERTDTAYILDVVSGDRHEITLPQYALLVAFSPDGSQFMYHDFGKCEACAADKPICILNVETRQSECIEPQGRFPKWSPTGEKLAFIQAFSEGQRLFIHNLRTNTSQIFYETEETNLLPLWVRLRPANDP